ncbi:uncharacterized protein LOC110095128 isoform X3 [Dendrobium catenatum]|uniref:uncharacterized protein LOC110095128 isoform X3 n=1 Tax=Dendrobium catenatum TaxID=906689 RepID=UPI00109F5600|nr:uncharacterized protein LOC110095128 isoform X3 [Dendrobium catenatum]
MEHDNERGEVEMSYEDPNLHTTIGERIQGEAIRHDIATEFWNARMLATLKSFGVQQMECLILPEDLKSEGKIKVFAFHEFSSNSDAMAAFQRLRKPDVFFGRHNIARVVFVRSPLHPSQEVLLQVLNRPASNKNHDPTTAMFQEQEKWADVWAAANTREGGFGDFSSSFLVIHRVWR